ncbi:MGMT family protein [Rhodopirellula sp. JC740]|uniref:MGMT family protein n=1 Tax=Rhodopirellula halodulae TaxID=2894198 RepID=A0ABS8NRN7_9BACT|nr:MGMT family protein [Rhodopirellula sp. JC740]MCC9645131.1 MGMT family protein [Rhodopirellula sp. JC740]
MARPRQSSGNSKRSSAEWTRREEETDPMRIAFVRVIESLKSGEVVSYGDVAERAGYPRRHRAVGQLLGASVDALPWWRVVYNDGRLPPVNPSLQDARLVEEGVTLVRLKVTRSPRGRFAN